MENRIALGLDVSKLNVDVCLLFPDGKKLRTKIKNTRAGFIELQAWLHGLGLSNIHACLEPTGRYSRPLAYFLCEVGIEVSLVNSFAVLHHGRSKKFRSKSDRIDAFLLADYCLKHTPPAWEPPSALHSELKDIQHRLICIDEMINQEENRLEAGTDSRIVYQDIEESLGRLYVRKKELEKAAKELIRQDDRLSQNFAILKSIIGIGDTSGIQMLAGIEFEKFENGRKVASFAGLAPQFFDSGTSVHKVTRISKMGNSQVRAALYFPAMCAMQHNPQLREFADRLRARNKPKKAITCAVMRKLLVLSAALIRKQEMYDPHYAPSALALA